MAYKRPPSSPAPCKKDDVVHIVNLSGTIVLHDVEVARVEWMDFMVPPVWEVSVRIDPNNRLVSRGYLCPPYRPIPAEGTLDA